MIIENRFGASGMIGTQYVARAVPDGYTIQYTVADSHSVNPHVFQKIPYDALKDFTPVALVGSMPNVLAVSTKIPSKSLKEFIELAKLKPSKFTYASWGVGSGAHIRTEAFKEATGTELLHVPFQGSGPAFAAVIGGQIDLMMVPLSMAYAHVKSGKIRILGIDTLQRVAAAPEIPTFTEQGVPLTLAFWQGVLAPANTPDPVIKLLNSEINAMLDDPQAHEAITMAGVIIGSAGISSISDINQYMKSEYDRWGKVIKSAHITAEQ